MSTKYEQLEIPQSIIINKNKYCFQKYQKSSDLYKYRCVNRKCKAYIKIVRNDLDKIYRS